MDPINLSLFISGLAGLAGLGVAGHIFQTKSSGEKLVCPAGFDCDTVIYSKHSKFMGIPVEGLGMAYYLVITLSYAVFLFIPQWNSDTFSFFTLSITTVAFIFSAYLTYIQAVVLRQWCTWCLMSALLCTIIFTMVWISSDLNIIEFLNTLINNVPFI